MDKKKLVAAVTALSLATSPTSVLASGTQGSEEGAPLTASEVTEETRTDVDLTTDENTTVPAPNGGEPAGEGSLTGETQVGTGTADGNTGGTSNGDPITNDSEPSASEGETDLNNEDVVMRPTDAEDVLVASEEETEAADDELQTAAVVELSGTITADDIDDPSASYVLTAHTTIDLMGRNITANITSISEGIVVTGGGSLTVPNGISTGEACARNGASLYTTSLWATASIEASGGSYIHAEDVGLSGIHVVGNSTVELGSGSTISAYVENSTLTVGDFAATDSIEVAGGTFNATSLSVAHTTTLTGGAALAVAANMDANGEVSVTGGSRLRVGGTLSGAGDVNVPDGSVGLGALNNTGDAIVSGGSTLSVNGSTATGNISVDGGRYNGGGDVFANGGMSVGSGELVSGGVVSATGEIAALPGGRITGEGGGTQAAITAAGGISGAVLEPEGGTVGAGGAGSAVLHEDGALATDTATIYHAGDVPAFEYLITSGNGAIWTQGSVRPLLFGTNGEGPITDVRVNGTSLTEGRDYMVFGNGTDDGSVYVLISPVLLEGLDVATYEIAIDFGDGVAAGTFSVAADDDGPVEPPTEYNIVSGVPEWEQGSDETISFETDGEGPVEGVSVDGEELNEGLDYVVFNDGEDDGPAQVVLSPTFLEGLELGYHEIVIDFGDGTATGGFIVVPAENGSADYIITSGDDSVWAQGSDDHLPFVSNGPVDEAVAVYVNGLRLASDEFEWTDAEGDGENVGVTLDNDYLHTLAVGDHDLVVAFDEDTAEADFSVVAAADTDDGDGTDDGAGSGSGSATGTGSWGGRGSGYGYGSSKGSLPKTGDPAAAVAGVAGAGALFAAIGHTLRKRRES